MVKVGITPAKREQLGERARENWESERERAGRARERARSSRLPVTSKLQCHVLSTQVYHKLLKPSRTFEPRSLFVLRLLLFCGVCVVPPSARVLIISRPACIRLRAQGSVGKGVREHLQHRPRVLKHLRFRHYCRCTRLACCAHVLA